MADKDQSPKTMVEKDQSPKILAPANGHAQSDEESATAHLKELPKKKRMKCITYIVAFAVLQTIIILVFALVVMRIKNPKFRVRSGSFVDTFQVGTVASPSFNLSINTQLTVKNANFGHFKYEDGMVTIAYRGITVGQVSIENARVKARSTKKVNATVVLNSNTLLSTKELGRDIGAQILPLTSFSKLEGKIHLMKVIKKKKSARMDCTMEVVINTQKLQNIVCKLYTFNMFEL